jgi:hypothetical protein
MGGKRSFPKDARLHRDRLQGPGDSDDPLSASLGHRRSERISRSIQPCADRRANAGDPLGDSMAGTDWCGVQSTMAMRR